MACELGAGDFGSSLGLATGSSRPVSNTPRYQCRRQADSGWLEEEVTAFPPWGSPRCRRRAACASDRSLCASSVALDNEHGFIVNHVLLIGLPQAVVVMLCIFQQGVAKVLR